MTVRELYNLIRDRYPKDRRVLNALAWPLHQPTLGIQFVDDRGDRIGPIVQSPVDFLIPEPLGGPFYNLVVQGICPIFPVQKKWKAIRIVVKTDHGFDLSSVIPLRIKLGELKGLAHDLGIQWYHVRFDWPWTYTCVPNFDDCVEYERKANEDSIQLR